MNSSPEDEALKFMMKSRLSHILNNVERRSVAQTMTALGHLLADLNAVTNGLPESHG